MVDAIFTPPGYRRKTVLVGRLRTGHAESGSRYSASTQLRRTRHQARGDARPEDSQGQQRHRSEHHDQRVVDGRLIRCHLEFGKQPRAIACGLA